MHKVKTVKSDQTVKQVQESPPSSRSSDSHRPKGSLLGMAVTLAYNFVSVGAQSASPIPSCEALTNCETYFRCQKNDQGRCFALIGAATMIIALAFVATCVFSLKRARKEYIYRRNWHELKNSQTNSLASSRESIPYSQYEDATSVNTITTHIPSETFDMENLRNVAPSTASVYAKVNEA